MLCWLMRWFIACREDNNVRPGPRLEAHMDACPACRRYYQMHQKIGDMLETQPAPEASASGESLQDAILGSLARSETAVDCSPASGWRSIRAVAACLLVVLSATLVGRHMMAQKRARMREHSSVLTSVATLSERLAPRQLLVNYGSFMQAPLESEVEKLSMDAQNAALFVVQCTPFARADTAAMK